MIHWDLLLRAPTEEEQKVVLENLYLEMSIAQMAEYFGTSQTAVRRCLARFGIPLRPRGGKHVYEEKGGEP